MDYAMNIIKYGSSPSDDGYWNSKQMLAQEISQTISIFEQVYPDHIAVFAFDHSSGPACNAEDVLVASRMNLNHGGKESLMRDTTIIPTGSGYPLITPITQHMISARG
jgi:hypothetical protein